MICYTGLPQHRAVVQLPSPKSNPFQPPSASSYGWPKGFQCLCRQPQEVIEGADSSPQRPHICCCKGSAGARALSVLENHGSSAARRLCGGIWFAGLHTHIMRVLPSTVKLLVTCFGRSCTSHSGEHSQSPLTQCMLSQDLQYTMLRKWPGTHLRINSKCVPDHQGILVAAEHMRGPTAVHAVTLSRRQSMACWHQRMST